MTPPTYDLLVLGAGAAGMPAAIFAAQAGARVLVVDAADRVGGSFHLSGGMMSAAGTRLQAARGIHDTPQMTFDDVMRISHGTANPEIVRLAVDHAADTLHWLLDAGFAPLPDHPVITYGHEPYHVPRTYWAETGGRAVLAAIAPLYAAAEASGLVETWLETRLLRLTTAAAGTVTGAVVQRDGTDVEVTARRVLLATGGYTANAPLFSSLSHGRPLWGGGWPYNKGEGLLAAVAAGSEIVNADKFLPGFAGVEDPAANGGYTAATITAPQERQPWEVYLDSTGQRFMREDDPDIERREKALGALEDMTFWALWDEAIRTQAPPFFTIDDQALAERFATLPGYCTAPTLAALAAQIGIEAATLTRTIDGYNRIVAQGAGDPLGREHLPAPIAQAPFYAVRHVGWSITSFAGLKVDGSLRVCDGRGQPIGNLYAAGEIVGLGATCGEAFVGGMSVTPALAFGRLLGMQLAREIAAEVTLA